MKTRRAASMIELLLIMSACTVVLTLTGVLLHRGMSIQMQSRARVDAERTSLRLANQFRRDVHEARAAITLNGDQGKDVFLQLEFADGRTAEYSREEGTVLRLESGGDEQTWREEFVFPAVGDLTIEEESEPRRLILTITAKPTEQQPADGKPRVSLYHAPVSLQAEAVVGRNWRFNAAPAGQEAPE